MRSRDSGLRDLNGIALDRANTPIHYQKFNTRKQLTFMDIEYGSADDSRTTGQHELHLHRFSTDR